MLSIYCMNLLLGLDGLALESRSLVMRIVLPRMGILGTDGNCCSNGVCWKRWDMLEVMEIVGSDENVWALTNIVGEVIELLLMMEMIKQ